MIIKIVVIIAALIHVISTNAVPPAPASAPALPNIPGLSSIMDDLMKVVEKAKSRWDAFQNGYGSGFMPDQHVTNTPQSLTSDDIIDGVRDVLFSTQISMLLGSLLFPHRRKEPSRVDQSPVAGSPNSKELKMFSSLIDQRLGHPPIPYQSALRRSSYITTSYAPPNEGVSQSIVIPKNVPPSIKLIHRPTTPVSNCLYGASGTLCLDNAMPLPPHEWEDLFANVELTEY